MHGSTASMLIRCGAWGRACRINAWPPAIFEMRNLRHLVLHAHSTWARLPPALGQLASLETLEVRMAIEGGCEPLFLHILSLHLAARGPLALQGQARTPPHLPALCDSHSC